MTGPRLAVFDAHLHVVDPRFPLVGGYRPPPFLVADYQARTAGLRVVGGAVVSGSFQGFDQAYLRDALARLGPGFVGVTQLPPDAPDGQVLELAASGVRALRVNARRGGTGGLEDVGALARRVFDLAGWHTELYVDTRDLPDLAGTLAQVPRLCVDHLGLSRAGLPALLRLVERGAHVKATGFGRGDLDVPAALRALVRANPAAVVFGTDLPSTRAPRPFTPADLDLVVEALDPADVPGVLHDNARALYRV